MSAKDTQVGGDHYRDMPIQPAEFIHKNGLGFIAGCVVKYVCRYQSKNGRQDLEKARHYLDLLIEMEYPEPASGNTHMEFVRVCTHCGGLADEDDHICSP